MRAFVIVLALSVTIVASPLSVAGQSIVPVELLRVIEAETDAYFARDVDKW